MGRIAMVSVPLWPGGSPPPGRTAGLTGGPGAGERRPRRGPRRDFLDGGGGLGARPGAPAGRRRRRGAARPDTTPHKIINFLDLDCQDTIESKLIKPERI